MYPFDLVKNTMIVALGHPSIAYSGFIPCTQSIFRDHGVKGFYRGF